MKAEAVALDTERSHAAASSEVRSSVTSRCPTRPPPCKFRHLLERHELPGVAATNARDRIGAGPWFNAKGVLIARDLGHLHDGNNLSKDTALDERGNVVKGNGDRPNEHDMLTGSRADGTAFAPQTDTTCRAWTSSTDGSAIVGHHDRSGPMPENWATSWNFSHQSAGCSQEALITTGGAGRFYCFAGTD